MFSESFLRAVNCHFNWHSLPANGTAGGILVGFDSRKFEVDSWQNRNYSVSAMVRNIDDGFIWRFIVVYGSAYEEGKLDFITELHELRANWTGPTVIGGDFNLVCNHKEKSNGVVNHNWTSLFNDWINAWGLIEYKNSTRSFTWTNSQELPIMAAIDKIFCSTNFEQHFPLASVQAAARASSDHVPLILDLGLEVIKKPSLFRFEKWWLDRVDFHELVRSVWNKPCSFQNPLDAWQYKIRNLRKKAKGWARNVDAEIKKNKQNLLKEFEILEVFQESGRLSDSESLRLKEIINELENIWKMEETKAKQRSRDRNVREGDRNTAYFQALANQRNRKKKISVLEGPDGPVTENKDMLALAGNFYKNLFVFEEILGVRFDDSFWEDKDKVTSSENEMLEAPFSESEIKEAVFDSYADGAPGPDGFSFLFYQHFWDLIK